MNSPANTPDLSNLWMPFTANRQFKQHPRLLAKAKGMYYTASDGHRILDGTAGLWCVNAGHGRQEIIDAIRSEEHTSELQSLMRISYAGFCLKKKKNKTIQQTN